MSVVIYTALFGAHTDLKEFDRKGITCFCFTDDPELTSNTWQIIQQPRVGTPRMDAKWPKMNPDTLGLPLNDGDYSIWVDASIQITDVEALIKACCRGDLALFLHPERHDIYGEAAASVSMPKYTGMPLQAQVDAYRAEGLPGHALWAGGVIARRQDRNHENISLGLKWYHECRRWSPQDQLSLPYVLWKLGIEPNVIPGSIYETEYLKHIWTGPSDVDSGVRATGYWRASDAHEHHGCSGRLAAWIADHLSLQKDKLTYDLGCGTGYYLAELKKAGYSKLVGIEGEPPDHAVFSPIEKQDLTSKAPRPSGNVICLEVGEHIPAEHEASLLDTITSYCDDKLILSWAIRGQGGRGHVNCLDNHEVINRMASRGFVFDQASSYAARLHVDDNTPWFRKTLMVFNRAPQKIDHFYQTLPGYFTFPDFYRWLAREFPGGHGVEVGSFAGRSAAFLAVELHNNASANTPRLDLVDMFVGIYMAGYVPGEKQIRSDLAPVAHIIGDIHSMQSWDAADKYADGSLDFVYIDADHHYEPVKRDIAAWLPKVRSGGIIAGHDFCNYPGFGVIEAVMERFDRVDVWRGERFFGDGVRSFEDPQQFGGTPGQFFPSWCVRV